MMVYPGMLPFYDMEKARRISTWAAYYRAKGCSEHKAWNLARRKVSRKATWPPKERRNG